MNRRAFLLGGLSVVASTTRGVADMGVDVVAKYGLDMSGGSDNSAKLAQWASDAQAVSGPQPRYIFTNGLLAYQTWPTFTVPDAFQMVADGQCILKCTGPGDAVTLNGDAGNMTWRVLFDGFYVLPTQGNGLVTRQIHDSTINVDVLGAPVGKTCVYVYFSVLTDFEIHVNGYDIAKWGGSAKGANGVVFDSLPGAGNGQTSKSRLLRPNISSVQTGVLFNDAGMCDVLGGAVEGCGTGFHGVNGGNNHIAFTDFEANSVCDVQCDSGFHDNLFDWTTTQSSKKIVNSNITNQFHPTWSDDIGL